MDVGIEPTWPEHSWRAQTERLFYNIPSELNRLTAKIKKSFPGYYDLMIPHLPAQVLTKAPLHPISFIKPAIVVFATQRLLW